MIAFQVQRDSGVVGLGGNIHNDTVLIVYLGFGGQPIAQACM